MRCLLRVDNSWALVISITANNKFHRSIMIGLGLVGLVGNLLLVEQLLLLVVEQLLNPTPSSNHVSRKSLEEDEVTHKLFRI